jgi:hypothetical protein
MNLPHKKQGVSEQTAGAKTGLHSLLLVVKRTRSAVAKHADYCNPGLSEKKHGRASTGGWQWRTREVDVVGGYLLGGCYEGEAGHEKARESSLHSNSLMPLAPVILPAWLIPGSERPVGRHCLARPDTCASCRLGRGWWVGKSIEVLLTVLFYCLSRHLSARYSTTAIVCDSTSTVSLGCLSLPPTWLPPQPSATVK